MNKNLRFIIPIVVLVCVIVGLIFYIIGLKNEDNEEKSEKTDDILETHTVKATISQNDVDEYNDKFEKYLGDKVKGADVKNLIDDVISSNEEYANESGKFVSILVYGSDVTNGENCNELSDNDCTKITNYSDGKKLLEDCNAANFFDDGDNTQENVSAASEQMSKLKEKINTAKNYKVVTDRISTSAVSGVIIRLHIAQLK